jgi:Tfp pilus assembly protein PilE
MAKKPIKPTKNSARKNSNIVGRVANKNLNDYESHDIKNRTPSTPNPSIRYNKQAMENAIKKANAPKGPSATAVRAREIERKMTENNKRFGVGQSRPATKAETSATTAKYKATTARTMSSDKVAKNSVKVKPAAKTKPKPPNTSQIEHRFGMRNNRMIDRGVPVGARAAGGESRRDAIAESKLTGKPVKNTKPKLVMEKSPVKPRGGMRGGGLGGLNKANR